MREASGGGYTCNQPQPLRSFAGRKEKNQKENKTEGGKWKGAKPSLNKKVKKNKFEGVKPKPKLQGK